MQPISLSLFFPVYNEEANLRQTVAHATAAVEESPYVDDWEMVIVNDGSTDASSGIAHELAKDDPRVKVVEHTHNTGYGTALKSGISAATKDYIFFTDADLQFDIVELQNLLTHIARYPVVIGYRAPRRDPFMRLVNAWGWNILNRLLFGLRVRDIDCAFKIFRRDLVQALPLASTGAMINAEALIRLTRNNIPVKEVPVSHLPRTNGSPTGAKLSVIARAFGEMMRLYWGELGHPEEKKLPELKPKMAH